MTLFVISLLTFSLVSALESATLSWDQVKVDGDEVSENSVLAVEEGDTVEVRVLLRNSGAVSVQDVEVEARISGYEFGVLADTTDIFDIAAGTTKPVTLELDLPNKLDKDEYWLRLRVMDKSTTALERNVRLAVEPTRHGVQIADVSFSPGSTVKAGRSLLATVLLENFGDKDEGDVKVTVAIPSLGVSATEFVDVETNDHNVDFEDVPEVFLPIPATAREGRYDVVVTAQYNQLSKTVSSTYQVDVLANEMFQVVSDELVLAVGPELQTVQAGKTATFGIALTNAGTRSKAYVLQAMAGDWGSVALSDSVVVLEPGQNKVVYADVATNANALVGEHTAVVTIKSGSDVLETVQLKTIVVQQSGNASASSGTSLRNGLEIALVILVVVLVIIGLIIGFSRLRKDENGGTQTYY